MGRHIAYDIGAEGVTRALADRLDAPAILSRFSRLVIDPNRGEDDPTLLMRSMTARSSPPTGIWTRPNANGGSTPSTAPIMRPMPNAPPAAATRSSSRSIPSRRACSASPRPWQVGILYDPRDERLSRPLLDLLHAQKDLIVGENEPYSGHLPGDAIDRHGLIPGRPNTLIELRHDLIETPEQQRAWADRLAGLLEAARIDANL